jgi:hypothetical protein
MKAAELVVVRLKMTVVKKATLKSTVESVAKSQGCSE